MAVTNGDRPLADVGRRHAPVPAFCWLSYFDPGRTTNQRRRPVPTPACAGERLATAKAEGLQRLPARTVAATSTRVLRTGRACYRLVDQTCTGEAMRPSEPRAGKRRRRTTSLLVRWCAGRHPKALCPGVLSTVLLKTYPAAPDQPPTTKPRRPILSWPALLRGGRRDKDRCLPRHAGFT